MQRKDRSVWVIAVGVFLVLVSATSLMSVTPASAQCGSQASSCKNCHEVQGGMPVNSDGTAWHQSHAFGDFCYICHAGNNQATDKAEAHTGMESPLSDVKASCMQCHPSDLDERAQVYATTLGVEVGSGGGASAASASDAGSVAPVSGDAAVSAPVTTELDVNDPNLVDYVQNYDEIVLGKKPFNLGNTLLLTLIGLVTIGGGGYVVLNEKLVNVTFGDTKKADGEYPADVVDMLPGIAGLKSKSRKSLNSILQDPQKSEKVLDLIDEIVSEEKSQE